MRLGKLLLPGAIFAAGLSLGFFLLYGKTPPQPGAVPSIPVPVVEFIRAKPGSQALSVRAQGTVQARREIDLVSQVGGVVELVAPVFAEGGFFGADEVLVQLEQLDYQFAATRAGAGVADARQLLALERGRARQAKREWRDLKDRDANDLFLRKPQLVSAQAALAAAIAEERQAKLSLARTTIKAPFDGRILETYVDLGQYVTPGTPIARIHATDAVEVRLPLTDRQLALLNLSLHYRGAGEADDLPAVALSGRFGGRQWHWQGFIQRTDARIDSRSRVLYVVVEVPDPFVRQPGSDRPPLILGQFVEVAIPGRELADVLLLPRAALRAENTVWLLDAADRLQIEPVEVLQFGAAEVAVRGDFAAQVRVVTSSLALAVPGMALLPAADTREGS